MKKSEMVRLKEMLEEAQIPHEVERPYGHDQIIYPSREAWVSDAICHPGSFGYKEGPLEIMGLVDPDVGDEVEGWLRAEQVFEKWNKHWKKLQEEKGE